MDSRTADVSGTFKRYPVPRLLFYLLKKHFLGLMEVSEPEGGGGSIYFRDGLPSYSDLSSTSDVLGRVLLEWGLITEEDFNRSLELLAAGRGLQGQILLEIGAIDQEGLVTGLRLQLQRKLSRLFSLEEATFQLSSCEHLHGLGDAETLVQVDPLWVIHHGVRNAFCAARMAHELSKLGGFKVQLRPGFDRLRPRFGFNSEEQALVTLLTHSSLPVTEIQRVSNLGQLETLMLIYTLWVTEALVVTGADDQPVTVRSDSGSFSGPGPLTLAGAEKVDRPVRPARTPAEQLPATRPPTAPDCGAPGQTRPSESAGPSPERAAGGLLPIMTPYSERGDPPPTIILPPANAADEAPLVLLGGRPRPDPEQDGPAAGWLQRPQQSEAPAPDDPPPETSPEPRQPTPAASGTSATVKEHAALIERTFAQIEGKDHFQVLGLERGASVEQVRDAYFLLVKSFHPDRCSAIGLSELTSQALEIFRRISEAHTVLSNPAARQEYERSSQEGAICQEQAQAALQAELAYQKGVLLHRRKHFDDARSQFALASKLDPDEGEYQAWAAWCRFSAATTSSASELAALRRQLEQAVALSPRNPTCHYFLGEISLAEGNERRARQCFLRTVEFKQDHLEAQRQLRLMQLRQDKRATKSSGLLSKLRKK